MPGLMELTRIFFGAELLGEHAGDGIDRALGAGVDRAVRRRHAADDGADVDDAGAFAEVLDRGLRGEQEAEDVDVEHLVEVFFGDGLDGRELVDAGVVDEDVEAAEVLDGGVDDALGLGGLGDVAADGDGLAAGGGDGGDDGVGAGLAGGVVDDDGGAFGGERFGDGGADALGCAGDDCDFACELAHNCYPSFSTAMELLRISWLSRWAAPHSLPVK